MVRGDPTGNFLICCFDEGLLQINDIKSGELIYNNASIEPIKLDHEIAYIAFFGSQSKYWMAIGCWDGKVAFITRP